MANDTGTLADVSAWCRDIARSYRNAPSNKIEIEGLKVCDYLDELANRIDAAAKREIPQPDPDWKAICERCSDGDLEPDCEYYGEPNGCNSPIYGEHPKAQPAGNAAALRTALKRLRDATRDFYNQILNSQYRGILDKYTCAKQGFPAVLDVRAAIPAANAALAAAPAVDCPPSNVTALRDALTPWVSLAEWLIENAGKEALGRGIAEIVPTLRKRIDESKSALAEPPRNCDVGTPVEQERRMNKFCRNVKEGGAR